MTTCLQRISSRLEIDKFFLFLTVVTSFYYIFFFHKMSYGDLAILIDILLMNYFV